jgi:hypothetical protein
LHQCIIGLVIVDFKIKDLLVRYRSFVLQLVDLPLLTE